MAPEAQTGSQLLTPKYAAERLAISPRKLWALTASGDVPCVRIGRAVRYDFVAVLAALKQQNR